MTQLSEFIKEGDSHDMTIPQRAKLLHKMIKEGHVDYPSMWRCLFWLSVLSEDGRLSANNLISNIEKIKGPKVNERVER